MRALVVDDARAMRLILRQILQKIGFEVIDAGNGREALDRLRELGRPDVVLVDGYMPEMDGFAFLQAVRSDPACAGLRVILVTAEETASHEQIDLDAAPDAYLFKPFTEQVIREKLDRLGLTPSLS